MVTEKWHSLNGGTAPYGLPSAARITRRCFSNGPSTIVKMLDTLLKTKLSIVWPNSFLCIVNTINYWCSCALMFTLGMLSYNTRPSSPWGLSIIEHLGLSVGYWSGNVILSYVWGSFRLVTGSGGYVWLSEVLNPGTQNQKQYRLYYSLQYYQINWFPYLGLFLPVLAHLIIGQSPQICNARSRKSSENPESYMEHWPKVWKIFSDISY